MNYCEVKYCDVANGLGCRTVLFVSGCRNHCKGCFQPDTWDFAYGKPFDEAIRKEIIDSLAPDYVSGLTLLGGDPFEPENQKELLPFLREVVQYYPMKNIWAFTGYLYDSDLQPGGRRYTEDTDEMLSLIDVLVDGPFIEEEKDIRLKFRGSANQRVIDLKESAAKGKIVLAMD